MRPASAIVASLLVVSAIARGAEPSDVTGCPTAPSPWTVTKRPGPDFDVCHYRAKGHTGFFGIYLGFHPEFFPNYGEAGMAGSVGGRPVEWFPKQPVEVSQHFTQNALVYQSPGDKKSGPVAHVWIRGDSVQELDSVRDAVAQIQW